MTYFLMSKSKTDILGQLGFDKDNIYWISAEEFHKKLGVLTSDIWRIKPEIIDWCDERDIRCPYHRILYYYNVKFEFKDLNTFMEFKLAWL